MSKAGTKKINDDIAREVRSAINFTSRMQKITKKEGSSQATDKRHVSRQEREMNKLRLQSAKSSVKSAICHLDSTIRVIRASRKAAQKARLRRDAKEKRAAGKTKDRDPLEGFIEDYHALLEGEEQSVEDLEDMLEGAYPVLENYEALLRMPDIDEFNAAITIAPVMGFKQVGSEFKLVYVKNEFEADSSTFHPEWETFSDLPSGAKVRDMSQVFVFPHLGNLMLSVNGELWKLKKTSDGDGHRKYEATKDFRKMYLEDWEKVSDEGIRSDTVSVIPFASLFEETLETSCVLLTESKKFYRLKNSDFGQQNEWIEIRPKSSSDALQWYAAAYDGGYVSAYALRGGNESLHRVEIDLESNEYHLHTDMEMVDKFPTSPKMFASNEVGLISERENGKLYQRIVKQNPNDPGDVDKGWNLYIDTEGVTNLGIASPGVFADLRMVVGHLRRRYFDVQEEVAPGLVTLISHCRFQLFYLDELLELSESGEWKDMTDDELYEEAEFNLGHTRDSAEMIHKANHGSQEAAVQMYLQLLEISRDLEAQLVRLRRELKKLEEALDGLTELRKKILADLYAFIGATIISLIGIIAGVATGAAPAVITGGIAAVGNAVALGFTIASLVDVDKNIRETEALIESTTNAINSMEIIVDLFSELEFGYSQIVKFWGRMIQYGNELWQGQQDLEEQMRDAVRYIFSRPYYLRSSIEVNGMIRDGAQAYLDMLYEQGIVLPPRSMKFKSSYDALMEEGKRFIKERNVKKYLETYAKLAGLIKHAFSTEKYYVEPEQRDDSLAAMGANLQETLKSILSKLEAEGKASKSQISKAKNKILISQYRRVNENVGELFKTIS